jgi:outer membrane protein assembly factor BamB
MLALRRFLPMLPARARGALRAGVFGCLALALLGGCETLESINPFADDGEEQPADLVDFNEEARIDVRWDTQVGDGQGDKFLGLAPAVSGPRVYAADAWGVVEAYERETGKRVWRVEIANPTPPRPWSQRVRFWMPVDDSFVSAGVGAGAGALFVGTDSGEVIALDDLDGRELWRARVSSEVASAPQTDGDIVAVMTLDGKLVALDRATGARRWSYDTQVPVLTLRGAARPILLDGIVIAAFPNGRLVALRAKGGEPVWEHRVALPQGRSELDRMVDVDGAPTVAGQALYAASYQGRIKALRLGDGNPVWEREMSSYQSLTNGQGLIYVVGKDDQVNALDQQTGETTWSNATFRLRALTGGAVSGSYLLFGDAQGYLHALAQSDGRVVARMRIDSDGQRSDFTIADGVIYGYSNGGTLYAVSIVAK